MYSAHLLDNGVQMRSHIVNRLMEQQLARSVAVEIATEVLVLQAKLAAVHIIYVAYA